MNLKNIVTSMKTIIVLVLLLAIILSLSKILDNYMAEKHSVPIENDTIEDSTFILERVERLKELSSNKYFYSNVIVFKDSMKIKELQLPFTEKSFLIKYDGYVKAGIDVRDIDILLNEGKTIKIKLKNSKILDHVIDEKSIYVYDEKDSIFNKLSINDIFNQLAEEKEKIEEKLIEKGFLKDTDDNVRMFLEEFLKSLGYENVEIEFEI